MMRCRESSRNGSMAPEVRGVGKGCSRSRGWSGGVEGFFGEALDVVL